MSRIRWWLANRIAPSQIMSDPFPGYDGVFLVYRKDGFRWAMRADRLRLKATSRLRQWDWGVNEVPEYEPSGTFARFVGTAGKP